MIKPLHDTIVVQPDPFEQKGLIIVPEEETKTGTVLAVGPGKKMPDGKIRKMLVAVGDRVMYSGTIDRTYDGMLLMRDKDVIGLI